MQQDLERVRREYGGTTAPTIFLTLFQGIEFLAGRLVLDDLEILVLASELYPAVQPIILITDATGNTEQISPPWLLDQPAEDRLLSAICSCVIAPGPYKKSFGIPGLSALTADPERARTAGWTPFYTGADPGQNVATIQEGLFARSAGLLSTVLSKKRVLVCGLGSVGSYMAEQFARSGVGSLTLVDDEKVEPANLSRTIYTLADLGQLKTHATRQRLLQINPALGTTTHTAKVQEIEISVLQGLIGEADLIIAATDDGRAQLTLNQLAYGAGKPALFPVMYAGAQGGEVIVSVPPATPCFLCATRLRHAAEEQTSAVSIQTDYGTGRLVGEVALGADIQHVASSAVKMGLSLLLPDSSLASLKTFLDAPLAAGASYFTSSTVQSYWFFPSVFGETPGQFSYQSVWMTPERSDDCPVCGLPEHRVDPAAMVCPISLDALRASLRV